MIIRLAREEDAAAMARVTVDTFLAAHREQLPAQLWAKRAQEWTYEVSEQGWLRTLRCLSDLEEPTQDVQMVAARCRFETAPNDYLVYDSKAGQSERPAS